jgi:hypothetical protein
VSIAKKGLVPLPFFLILPGMQRISSMSCPKNKISSSENFRA